MNQNTSHIITRFPPSPTGLFHIGGARTALYNYLFAKQHSGVFHLRIEDTDTRRSKEEFEENIYECLNWLNITSDQNIIKQSERSALYKNYIEKLIASGNAYFSQEHTDDEEKRSEVIRFKNPNKIVEFDDIIRGHISVDTTDLGDFIIAKSLNEPLYHLAVVVDDFETGITHIIRGEDHISNTPRQILLQRAIGAPLPTYAHIPMILGNDKSKLSKRHGAVSVLEYKEKGFLPEALINYIALLGWHPSESDQEIFTQDELLTTFSLHQVQKAGAVFSIEKLRWVNRQHILRLSPEAFATHVREWLPKTVYELDEWSEERFKKVLSVIKDRIFTFYDIQEMHLQGEIDFYFSQPSYSIEALRWKNSPLSEVAIHLSEIRSLLSMLSENPQQEEIKNAVWIYVEEHGKGDVLWPLRYALSGLDKSPNPFEIIAIIGKTSTLSRIDIALNLIETYKENDK